MTVSTAAFDYVRDLVAGRSGIALESRQAYLADARLAPVARAAGLGSVDDLVARLRIAPSGGLATQVVEAMTTNETSFFRDIGPFEALAQEVLPELMRRRAQTRTLTIWSAACSSGQEPYTIAMLLRERFPALAGWRVTIVATDLSSQMVERARAGRFSQLEVNRGLPARLLVKHFTRAGTQWQISDDLRRAVEFRQLNLVGDRPPLPAADVVFLRNVLIYFATPTKRAILGKVRSVLRPDGTLFLGGAETTLNLDDGFKRVQLGHGPSYRLKGVR
ncbi:protein-glutamate O-methyltransferase CheR [soil metagenome]